MKGFTDSALILLPHIECYEYKGDDYYKLLRKAIDNIIAYCKYTDMTPYMLMTDSVAMAENRNDVKWVQTLTPGDLIFAKHNCDIRAKDGAVKLIDAYKKALAKYPPSDPANVEEYFQGMLKRVDRIEKDYISKCKCIFTIQTPNHCSYNIKPTAGDGRILIKISNTNFMPTTYISDMEINPIELLNFPCANLPVIDWRLPNG